MDLPIDSLGNVSLIQEWPPPPPIQQQLFVQNDLNIDLVVCLLTQNGQIIYEHSIHYPGTDNFWIPVEVPQGGNGELILCVFGYQNMGSYIEQVYKRAIDAREWLGQADYFIHLS